MNFRPYFVPVLAAFTIFFSSAAPVWSAEYNLRKPVLNAGQTINCENTMTMTDAVLTFNFQGQTIKGTMSMTRHKVKESRITAANDGNPTESETEFKEASQKQTATVNGETKDTEKNEPLHGLIVVSNSVDGKWQNHLKTGEPTPEQDKALKTLKAFDSDDMYEDHPVTLGASWTLEPDRITKMLGESTLSNTTGSMQCKFERVETVNDQPCAVIAVTMKVSGTLEDQPGSRITMELKGNVFRSLERKVDLKVDLAGSMKMEGAIPGAPAGSTMETNGPMTLKQTATVSK